MPLPTDQYPSALAGTAVSGLRFSPWSVANQTIPDRDALTTLHVLAKPSELYTDTAGAGFYVHGPDLGTGNLIGIGVVLNHASAVSGKTATFKFWGEREGHEVGGATSGPSNTVEYFRQHLFDLAVAAGSILLATGSRMGMVNGAASGQSAYCTTLTVSNSTVISPGVREVGYGFPMLFFDKTAYRRIWCVGKIGNCDRFRLATVEV